MIQFQKKEHQNYLKYIDSKVKLIMPKILEQVMAYEEAKKNGTLKPPPKNGFCD